MLSKEEIEARKQIVELLKTATNTNDDVVTLKLDKSACKTLYGYIEELETREQKLIEKLEEDNKRNKETVTYYEQARRDCKDESEYKKIYQNNINTLNAKREVRKEILGILKGENQ